MLYTLDSVRFAGKVRETRIQSDENYGKFRQVFGALTACWMQKLGPQRIAILLFLMNRTLFYRKSVQRLSKKQFAEGVVANETGDKICDGVGLSENTLRQYLSDLCDDDFIHVYRSVNSSGIESSARLYEINCNKILEPYEAGRREAMHLKTPKQKKTAQSSEKDAEKGAQICGQGGSDLPPITIEYNKDTNVSYVRDPSGARNQDSGAPVLRVSRKRKALATEPEETAEEAAPVDTARAVASRITAAHRARRDSRVAAVGSGKLDKSTLQALFDKLVQDYGLRSGRVIVTNKEAGLIRKRVAEYGVEDVAGFFGWCLRYWDDIALSHQSATRKKGTGKPMGSCPNIADLAYRMPYFLAAYKNHKAGVTKMREERDADSADRVRGQLNAAKQENEALRRRVRELSEQQRKPAAATRRPAPQRVASRNTQATDDYGADDLPEWS